MKKLLMSALAVLAFTACSQDEVVEQSQLQASAVIAFDGAFVDNATRAVDPSTTTNTINEFSVWGFMDEAGGDVFNNETVTKAGSEWSYANLQYWVPDHTYYFAALSPVVTVNGDVKVTEATTTGALQLGLGTVEFTNKAGTTDLIYAAITATTTEENYLTMPKVGLTFNHLLSKVKFTFKNGFINENNTITIKNLKMKAPGAGTINLATADWWTSPDKWTLTPNKEVILELGDVNSGNEIKVGESKDCANERLTIPAVATQKYEVTFDVVLYSGSVEAYSRPITTYVEGVALEMGKAYNFTATLDYTNIAEDELKPIEFTTEVKGWDVVADNDLTTTLKNVTVESGKTLTLVSDAVVEGSLMVTGGKLDGAGHTLSAEETPSDNGMVRPSGNDATVTNLKIDGKGKKTSSNQNLRAIYITENGTYNIDGVTTTGTGYALNAKGTNITLNVSNSTFEGWTSYSSGTTAAFKNVKFTKGQYQYVEGNAFTNGYFRPYGVTTLTNCTFESKYTIDFSQLSGKALTFDNCFVGTEKITSETIKTLLSIENNDVPSQIEFK